MRKPQRKWESDGVEHGPSSINVILDWITSGTNYARWKGHTGGTTKQTLCGEIVKRMKAVGIHHHNALDIRAKISALQTSYNKAQDWDKNTGEGIRAEGRENAETIIHGMF
jgi:hypothetical protein